MYIKCLCLCVCDLAYTGVAQKKTINVHTKHQNKERKYVVKKQKVKSLQAETPLSEENDQSGLYGQREKVYSNSNKHLLQP